MKLTISDEPDQKSALKKLAKLAERSFLDPLVRKAAITITSECEARDDRAELEAIFDAVKRGDDRIAGLAKGLRYVADPRVADYFVSPARTLRECADGSCGGDCDDHSSLIAALAGSLGFVVGLRAWGPDDAPGEYTHVYAVAAVPKNDPDEVVGMDSTVKRSSVGWEPPGGHVMTVWIY